MFLQVTEAGREFRLCDSSVSTSVVSHCYLLLFYNMFQSLLLQLPWLLHETRSKGTLRTYRHQAKMLTRGLQSCKQRCVQTKMKRRCAETALCSCRDSQGRGFSCCGSCWGRGFIGPSISGSGCQVAICFEATSCGNCILCVHHLHQRPDMLRVSKCLQFPLLQNVTAPVTSKLSWAIDRMSLLFFSSHAGLGLYSRLLY